MSLLDLRSLVVDLPAPGGRREVLRGVDLAIAPGESLGLIGESGCGKSMTARSIMRLLPPGAKCEGEIEFDGRSVPGMPSRELRRFRAKEVAMIFQDPRAHIDPVRSIGDFLTEGVLTTTDASRSSAESRAVALLRDVGIADAPRRMRQYPHELSGGLLQRVMIAGALMCEPRLLLADEPTTALDVTTQAEVMAILGELREEHGLAMLFITHDLDLAAAVCDRAAVMHEGTIVEERPAATLHEDAEHPYTKRLMAARPSLLEDLSHG